MCICAYLQALVLQVLHHHAQFAEQTELFERLLEGAELAAHLDGVDGAVRGGECGHGLEQRERETVEQREGRGLHGDVCRAECLHHHRVGLCGCERVLPRCRGAALSNGRVNRAPAPRARGRELRQHLQDAALDVDVRAVQVRGDQSLGNELARQQFRALIGLRVLEGLVQRRQTVRQRVADRVAIQKLDDALQTSELQECDCELVVLYINMLLVA